MTEPKISCLTVTLGRMELLKKSILCYLDQTYPSRELVIVSQAKDEQNDVIDSYLKTLDRRDIKFLRASPALSLGAMRNLSIEVATSRIVCQWDDDDLYHPLRLATQYHALLGRDVVASLYTEHLKYYRQSGELYWVDWSQEKSEDRKYLPGTVMFNKKQFEKVGNILYPEKGNQSGREEDWNVLQQFIKAGKIAPIKNGNHYVYVYHGSNTYDLNHHNHVLAKKVMSVNKLIEYRSILEETFKLIPIQGPIKVKSLSKVAFEYHSAISD